MPDETAGRDLLSRELRVWRVTAGLSGKEAARAAGFYPSKISRLELGHTTPSEDDVRLLAEVYRADADSRDRLVQMARDAKAEVRPAIGTRDVGGFQARIGRLEQQSELVRSFSANIVPGLLQSPGYVRALYSAGKTPAEEIETAITARLARQRILDDELNPRRFAILMTEGALGWAAGPPELMIEQVERIMAGTYRRNARIGVVPFGRPAGTFPLHGWTLFDQRAVIVGTRTTTAVLTERADVDAYVALTDELEALAVYGPEARAVLESVIDRYRRL